MVNQEIIRRYLDGEATEEELKMLKSYLGGRDLSILHQWMANDWSNAKNWDQDLPPDFSLRMLQNIKQKVAQKKVVSIKQNRRKWLVAATVLLITSIGLSIWLNLPPAMVTHITAYGEWKTLELPDGSWVKLNAHSKLSYEAAWSDSNDRQVWLEGEAFFRVERKPTSGAKFTVVTEAIQVEVLGTSFNVSNRGDQTDVFLEEGQIKLRHGNQEELLAPGDYIIYSAEEKAIVNRQEETPAELHTSWKDGVLILKDTSVLEILKKIEEIYGVTIKVDKDNLLNQLKTVTVPMDELGVAIPVLERALDVEIYQQEDQLTIQ